MVSSHFTTFYFLKYPFALFFKYKSDKQVERKKDKEKGVGGYKADIFTI